MMFPQSLYRHIMYHPFRISYKRCPLFMLAAVGLHKNHCSVEVLTVHKYTKTTVISGPQAYQKPLFYGGSYRTQAYQKPLFYGGSYRTQAYQKPLFYGGSYRTQSYQKHCFLEVHIENKYIKQLFY